MSAVTDAGAYDLRLLLDAAGLDVEAAARKMGLRLPTVQGWLAAGVNESIARRAAELLGVSAGEVWELPAAAPTPPAPEPPPLVLVNRLGGTAGPRPVEPAVRRRRGASRSSRQVGPREDLPSSLGCLDGCQQDQQGQPGGGLRGQGIPSRWRIGAACPLRGGAVMVHRQGDGPHYFRCYDCGYDSREDLRTWSSYADAIDAADRHDCVGLLAERGIR